MTRSNSPVALITGASSGIGAVYADRLARRGYDLILVARRQEKLLALAQRVFAETGHHAECIAADLAEGSALRSIEKRLRNDGRVELFVNNAGIGAVSPLLATNVDRMQELVNLDVLAPMRLIYAVAPEFVHRGKGTIINIASVVAVAPELLNGVYGAAKAFILALSQSLRYELAPRGVRIQVVLPGGTATEFWDLAGQSIEAMSPERRGLIMKVEDLVDAALAGLDAGEFVTVPPLENTAAWSAFEAARLALRPQLRSATPATRYHLSQGQRQT